MNNLIDIFVFWIKVVGVIFVFTSGLAFSILVLSGSWNEVSLLERASYALISGVANGLLLGTIASLWMGIRTWRVVRMNKKKLAKREQIRMREQTKS